MLLLRQNQQAFLGPRGPTEGDSDLWRRVAQTRSVLGHMSMRVPVCEQRPETVPKATWAGVQLGASGHAGTSMGTSHCFFGVTVISLLLG